MAKSVSRVLTMAYRDIYGEDDNIEDPAQLQLLTAPLAATDEVVALFTAGLAPCEIAMPAVLHAIGASKDEIDRAVEKACKNEERDAALREEERAAHKIDQALSIKEREANLANNELKQKVELEQARAAVAQTKKQTSEMGKTSSSDTGGPAT